MEETIRYFESQSDLLDRFDNTAILSTLTSKYISCITFNGVPILPPVMTAKRRDEMQTLKRQAQLSEKRVKSRQRHTLMARVQSIVDTTQNPEDAHTHLDPNMRSGETDLEMSRVSGENSTDPLTSTNPRSTFAMLDSGDQADPLASTNPRSTFAMLDSGENSADPLTCTNPRSTFAMLGSGDPASSQTLDSLSSDFVSLEETPLPTDFNGIPLTSVQQQQISQSLRKLSKALKLEDTQSLNSTGNSEFSEMLSLKQPPGHNPVPQIASAGEPVQSVHRQISSENNSSVFHDSQDTIIEVSQEVDGNSTSGFLDNVSSGSKPDATSSQNAPLQTSHNDSGSLGVNSSFNSANTSTNTADSHHSSKSSPKSLKNTVHFSQYVTEITRKSVEDSITCRKIDLTPTNSPRIMVTNSDGFSNLCTSNSNHDDSAESSPGIKSGSLLSRVDFSPECDSTPSPVQAVTVPFQAYFTDAELSTSDKENDQNQASHSHKYRIPSMSVESVSGESRTSSQLYHSNVVTDSQGSYSSSTVMSGGSRTVGRTSESEGSTLKESNVSRGCDHFLQLTDQQEYISSDTGSTNLQKYMQTLISSQGSVSHSCSSSKDHCAGNETGCNNHDVNVPVLKRSHPLRESYTLSEPSPALMRSQCRTDKESNVEKKVHSVMSAEKHLQHKADCRGNDGQIELVSIPLPPGPEHDGKAEHINRYLSQIHQQNLKNADKLPVSPKARPQNLNTMYSQNPAGNSISMIQSLLQNMNSLPDTLTEEEMLKIQASHFQVLQQQVISQQQKELEELFVRQRKEQLSLEGEVKMHQKSLQEQQEFLAENAPETVKKSKHVSKEVFAAGDQVTAMGAENRNNLSTGSGSQPKLNLFEKLATPSPTGPKVYRPVLRSPAKSRPLPRRSGTVITPEKAYLPQMRRKFEKISALAKGFLIRRLMQTDKVQELMKTIRDTQEFAVNFTTETPIKQGTFSNQDKDLLERITAQLQAAKLDIHEIFFSLSQAEQMSLIASTRQNREYKRLKTSQGNFQRFHRRISTATMKAIERKKKAQGDSLCAVMNARPRTAPPSTSSPRNPSTDIRALRPLQGQISPITAEGSSRSRVEPDRPKSAPEKGGIIHHTKLRKPDPTLSASTNNVSGKQNKLAAGGASTKAKVAPVTKVKTKPGKAWR
ncbi:centriolar coiled-coil protein of 110 kDa-like [Gigantopelta aegis]|uniref:centriolar coiled-coil protein of 110 kDa-like n=1 Tax=Gigantopelta aegis TaxID=1735272 RepID=UPI001B88A7A6|nr:centriolar coiled-coil protein of 110 kDa-like [Gigantopelta aegis]